MPRRSVAASFTVVVGCLASPSLAQTTFIGENFQASTYLLDSLQIPPDTMGAAGIDHYVELINGRFSVYNKSSGARVQTSTMNQFWTAAGAAPTGTSFDPRVVYDPTVQRWYACAVDNRLNANSFLFAISGSADPTGAWTGFKVDSDTDDSNWADFPMLGYNAEGVFISANMPALTAPGTRTGFLVLPKFGLLQPVPNITNATLIEDVPLTTTGGTPQLAIDNSDSPGPHMPMLSMFNTAAGVLQRTDITPPGAPVVNVIGTITVSPAAQPPTVDQPGPKQNLEANDSRFSGNTILHNGELFGVHTIADMGRSAIRYFRIDVASNTVLESAILADPSRAFTFPSININEFNDVVIGATGTSTTEFASSYAVVGKLSGGITSFNTPQLLRAGASDYQVLDSLSRNRWGDYSSTTVDPADPGIFWTNQEYAQGTDLWGTNVTELIILQPNEARWADNFPVGQFDDPTMWLTSHGGAPLNSEHLVFSRPSDPGTPLPSTVAFPPAPAGVYAHQSASVRQGFVLFDLGGSQWDLARQFEVGPYGGSPRAILSNGSLSSTAGVIARRSTSEGSLELQNATWNVFGELHVGGTLGAPGGRAVLTVSNNSSLNVILAMKVWPQGTVRFNSGSITTGPLDIDGGKILLSPLGPARTLRSTDLIMSPGSLIDLTRNFMIVDWTGINPLPMVVVQTSSGYAGGSWSGPGINSSTAATGFTHAVGFAEASAIFTSFPATFGGQQVDATSILLRYTRYGDANLSGTVDLDDFNILASNFGQFGKYWFEADFTFNGLVNLDDFNLLAGNFGLSAGPDGIVDPADWAALASAIPEPSMFFFGVVAAATRCLRRRR